MKDPRVRRGFLDSFYANLVHGDIQNLNPEAIEQVSNMMTKYGFESHAEKLKSYEQEAPANIGPAYQPLIETLQKIASAESGAYRDFDSHWYRVAEDQDRVKEIGQEAATKEKQEREKTAWKPQGYWPSARDSVLTNTWEAASYVIAEHIHTAGLPEAERTKRPESLRESLELEYVTKERLFGQLTHFGNGTDGHKMRNLGQGIKYDARDKARLQQYMGVLKEMLPEHFGMMMRGMFGKDMLDF